MARVVRSGSSSQVILLPGGTGVLVHVPFDIAVLVVKGTGPDLEQTHGHPRAHLCELYALISGLYENVVADLDAVVDVLEGDDAGTEFGTGLAWGEKMLEDLDDAFTQGSGEAVEDEVGVALADGAAFRVGDVVAEDDVVEGEAGGGAVGEVADGEGGGGTAVLVQDDDVAEAGRLC